MKTEKIFELISFLNLISQTYLIKWNESCMKPIDSIGFLSKGLYSGRSIIRDGHLAPLIPTPHW